MDSQQLLRRLNRAGIAFKDSYAGLSESEILMPGVTKAWSVRDTIAHVTTWEEEGLKHLPAVLEGRIPMATIPNTPRRSARDVPRVPARLAPAQRDI